MNLQIALPGMNLSGIGSLRLGHAPADAGLLVLDHVRVLRNDMLDALKSGADSRTIGALARRLAQTNHLAAKCMRIAGPIQWS